MRGVLIVVLIVIIYAIYMRLQHYFKIDGKWYRGLCDSCLTPLKGAHQSLCAVCWQESLKGQRRVVHNKPHSPATRQKISAAKLVQGQLTYSGLHQRLHRERGKADHCDNPTCPKTSAFFDWANYTRKYETVDDFIQLCRSCHKRFDNGSLRLEV